MHPEMVIKPLLMNSIKKNSFHFEPIFVYLISNVVSIAFYFIKQFPILKIMFCFLTQTKFIYSTVHIKVQYTKANPNDPFFVNSKSNKLFDCFCFLPTVHCTALQE